MKLQLERKFGAAAAGDEARRPVFASGERIDGSPAGDIKIEGNARVRRGGTLVTGDRITYAAKTQRLQANGQVRISRDGDVFSGPRLDLSMATSVGRFESASYELVQNGGRGAAAGIEFDGRDQIKLDDATYSTCDCDQEDWYMHADSLVVDNPTQEIRGRGASLYFKGLKVLHLPVFWFPTGDARRSGFLSPSIEYGSTTGVEVITPYYLNLAPNYDLTISPRVMTRRGLLLGGDFRYLSANQSGRLRADYNYNDWVSGSQRYQASWQHQIKDLAGWSGAANLNAVSDDNYFVDYGQSILATSTRNLPRDVLLRRAIDDWQVLVRATAYQSILDARAAPPYQRLPQIQLLNTQRDLAGFDIETTLEANRFTRRLSAVPEGWRSVAKSTVSYPILRPGGFFTPQLRLHLSSYQLDANANTDSLTLNRAVPTFAINSGLVFERKAYWAGESNIQTLEPRLFYSYTPYRDQDQIPVFDTGPIDFGFDQLFSPNLFVGDDRVADLNQVTGALVSRLIQPATGVERLRLGVAQRLTFGDQRVTIPGVAARSDGRSDVLFAASGDLGDGLSFDSGVQLSLADRRIPQFSFSSRYRPQSRRVFNVGVRYQRGSLGQVDTSFQWPINARWETLGRFNYSWADQQLDDQGVLVPSQPGFIETTLGFQYREDCWATRFVLQRFTTVADGSQSTRLFIQLELSGLGQIQNTSFDSLRTSIPGLHQAEDRSRDIDPYTNYR